MDFSEWDGIRRERKHLSAELNYMSNRIKAKPHDASNYLFAGRVHLIRGDYEEGLKIFKQGISMVTSDDPQRALLEQRKVHAETWIQRRVDIVSQCPYDIFSNIARYVTQKGAQECIGVCRVWRSKMFEDPGPWRKVSLFSYAYDSPLQILSLIYHHMEELTFELVDSYPILKCLEVLETSDFSNIKSLCERESGRSFIEFDFEEHRSITLLIDRAYRVLENMGKRLTYLEIGPMVAPGYTVSLERILPICKNLAEFRCWSSHITSPPSGIWLTNTTALTRLMLCAWEINLSTLEPILRCSPQLEDLAVDFCEDDITPIFEYYCPRLTVLAINSEADPCFSKNIPRDSSGNGRLRHVTLSRIPASRSLFSLLNRNASLLETLQIDRINGTTEGWRPISTFIAPNLKNLGLFAAEEAIRYHLVDILKANKHIQRLELIGFQDEELAFEATEHSNIDSVLRAIIDIHNLRELYLMQCFTQVEWYIRLFEHYAAQGQGALIAQLVVYDCSCPEWSTVLDVCFSVTKMTSLTHLGIIGDMYEYLPESKIVDLAKHIREMPKLSVLALQVKKFSIDAARYIISSTSLKRIYFRTPPFLGARTLEEIIDNETMIFLQSHGIRVANTNLLYFFFESLEKE